VLSPEEPHNVNSSVTLPQLDGVQRSSSLIAGGRNECSFADSSKLGSNTLTLSSKSSASQSHTSLHTFTSNTPAPGTVGAEEFASLSTLEGKREAGKQDPATALKCMLDVETISTRALHAHEQGQTWTQPIYQAFTSLFLPVQAQYRYLRDTLIEFQKSSRKLGKEIIADSGWDLMKNEKIQRHLVPSTLTFRNSFIEKRYSKEVNCSFLLEIRVLGVIIS
jgi:hypothetical protein